MFYKIKNKLQIIYLSLKYIINTPFLYGYILGNFHNIFQGYLDSHEYNNSTNPQFINNKKPLNPLHNYFYNHNEGPGIWKWDHYFDIYHQHFKKYIGKEVIVLEIGVYSGGSLGMWRKYFGSKSKIIGIDIESSCKSYESEQIEIVIGDQEDREFWKDFKIKYPSIDIVIDDGGHAANQQINTLIELLPHINPGGIYLCEDIQGEHNSFYYYLQGMMMNLNSCNFDADDKSISISTELQSYINSFHFYPYITVIKKSDQSKFRLQSIKKGTIWEPFFD